jgi:hypothetical protein
MLARGSLDVRSACCLASPLQQCPHRPRIAPLRIETLRLDPWCEQPFETNRQQVLLLGRHRAEDVAKLVGIVGRKVDRLGEPAGQSGIAGYEAAHFGWIAGDDDDQAIAVILHVLEQDLDRLAAGLSVTWNGGDRYLLLRKITTPPAGLPGVTAVMNPIGKRHSREAVCAVCCVIGFSVPMASGISCGKIAATAGINARVLRTEIPAAGAPRQARFVWIADRTKSRECFANAATPVYLRRHLTSFGQPDVIERLV